MTRTPRHRPKKTILAALRKFNVALDEAVAPRRGPRPKRPAPGSAAPKPRPKPKRIGGKASAPPLRAPRPTDVELVNTWRQFFDNHPGLEALALRTSTTEKLRALGASRKRIERAENLARAGCGDATQAPRVSIEKSRLKPGYREFLPTRAAVRRALSRARVELPEGRWRLSDGTTRAAVALSEQWRVEGLPSLVEHPQVAVRQYDAHRAAYPADPGPRIPEWPRAQRAKYRAVRAVVLKVLADEALRATRRARAAKVKREEREAKRAAVRAKHTHKPLSKVERLPDERPVTYLFTSGDAEPLPDDGRRVFVVGNDEGVEARGARAADAAALKAIVTPSAPLDSSKLLAEIRDGLDIDVGTSAATAASAHAAHATHAIVEAADAAHATRELVERLDDDEQLDEVRAVGSALDAVKASEGNARRVLGVLRALDDEAPRASHG